MPLPAMARAAQGIIDNPGLSDRAIAEKIGVGHKTVSRALAQRSVQPAIIRDTTDARLSQAGNRWPRPS